MIDPPAPRSIIARPKTWQATNTVVRFASMSWCHSSRDDLEEGRRAVDAGCVDEDVDRAELGLDSPGGPPRPGPGRWRRPRRALPGRRRHRAPRPGTPRAPRTGRGRRRPRRRRRARARSRRRGRPCRRSPQRPARSGRTPPRWSWAVAPPSRTAVARSDVRLVCVAAIMRSMRPCGCRCPRVYCRTINSTSRTSRGSPVTQYVFDPRDAVRLSLPDPHQRPDHGSPRTPQRPRRSS